MKDFFLQGIFICSAHLFYGLNLAFLQFSVNVFFSLFICNFIDNDIPTWLDITLLAQLADLSKLS